jgi:hypothetical protein
MLRSEVQQLMQTYRITAEESIDHAQDGFAFVNRNDNDASLPILGNTSD